MAEHSYAVDINGVGKRFLRHTDRRNSLKERIVRGKAKGSEDFWAVRDVSLQSVAVTQTAFEDAPVNLQADVVSHGYAGAPLMARLLDGSGKKIQEQTQRAAKDGQPTIFRFNFRPEKAGVSFFRVAVMPGDDAAKDGVANAEADRRSTRLNSSH